MANEANYDVALKITATTAEAQKAISEVDKSLKQFVKNVTGSEKALEGFAEVEEKVSASTRKFKVDLDDLSRGLVAAGNASKKIEGSLSGLGSSLRQTGANFSKFLTVPLLGVATLAVKSFGDQQEAIQRLNQSLVNNGSFSEKASQQMQSFASALQSSSIYSGDLITSQLALARNFTTTNEEAQKLVQAAADLSAATGQDLETSVKSLGKSLTGVAGPLDELVPAMRDLTKEQLIAGAAVDFVSKKFSGSAKASSETFNGQITKLKNTFGDFLTLIGKDLAPIFNSVVKGFQSVVTSLTNMDSSTRRTILLFAGFAAGIGPVLIGVGVLSTALSKGLTAVRLFGSGIVKVLSILAGPAGVAIAIAGIVFSIAGLINLFLELKKATKSSADAFLLTWRFANAGFQSYFVKPLLQGLQIVYDVLAKIPGATGQVFKDSSNFVGGLITGITDNKAELDAEISKAFEGTGQTAANAFTLGLADKLKEGLASIKDTFNNVIAEPVATTVTENTKKAGEQTEKLSEDAKKTLNSIGSTAVSGFSTAFSSITDGTKSAGEAFKDFATSAIDSIQRIVLEAALLRALSSAFPSVFGTPQAGATATAATGGFFNGKKITHRFAEGGSVSGPGTGTSDSILARLSNGEFVSDAKTVSYFGPDFFTNLKRMARGFNVAPSYAGGIPAFANGGLVSGQGMGETRVVIQNSGSPKEAKNVFVEQDAQGTVVNIILEDISRNGNISKGLQNSFGLRRGGV